jgi:Fe-S-cluster containining protein
MPLPAGDAQLVQIMDAALAEAALRAGPWLVCREGCTPCCHGAFAINTLDVERLRAGMDALHATDPNLAATLEQRAQAWIAEHGPAFPGDPTTGSLGTSDADQQAFEDFANEAPCPALDPTTGRCDVYAWRPMTCRVFGPPVRMDGDALGCCELCFHGATEAEIAACEMPIPHELEAQLLAELETAAGPATETDPATTTVVAYALLGPAPS